MTILGPGARGVRTMIAALAAIALMLATFGVLGHEHETSQAEHCATCHLTVGTPALAGPTLTLDEQESAPTWVHARLSSATSACIGEDPIRGPPPPLS